MAAVVLIGGAPGVGKTTLGRALAAEIDATSLTVDDLLTAVKAVTTPQSHPGLHVMTQRDSIDYFTTSSVAQLIEDASPRNGITRDLVQRTGGTPARSENTESGDGMSSKADRG